MREDRGEIFLWGKNTNGMLGLTPGSATPSTQEWLPQQLPEFGEMVKMLACGENFTLALSRMHPQICNIFTKRTTNKKQHRSKPKL
jgi:alpha-tubulin suppressor-like RCC1 family protein